MNDIRRKHELLRDECKRRADEAWLKAMRRDLTETERRDALDQAHALMVMSLNHARTVTASADVRPKKYTRQNAGTQKKTAAKLEFVRRVVAQCVGAKRQALSLAVFDHPEREQHFKSYGAVYRFLGRSEFL